MASASFVVSPRLIIPTAQTMEIIASIALIPTVWRDVNLRWLAPMAATTCCQFRWASLRWLTCREASIQLGGCVLLLVALRLFAYNRRPNLPDGSPFALHRPGGWLFAGRIVAGRYNGVSDAVRGITTGKICVQH